VSSLVSDTDHTTSSLPAASTSLNSNQNKYRTIRIYSHHPVHSSTTEPVPGLEQTLSWRPSGNLIASGQRFGFEGGGKGRKERCDVVFFERNGLRRGEFGVNASIDIKGNLKDGEKGRVRLPWGYKVNELRWSNCSNVLLLWIEREDEVDLGVYCFLSMGYSRL
jgi:elongator complex protein 1